MVEQQTAARPQRVVVGALLMVAATFCFVSLDSILKALAARHDVLFLAWGRNLFQMLYLMALMPFVGFRRMVVTRHPVVHALRGLLLVVTTVFVVLSLKVMPMAQTYAITFSTPLIATILAAIFLKEPVSGQRWFWILAGFAGVMFALQPQAPSAGLYLALPLVMAFANAIFHVLTRSIAADEDPLALLFLVAAAAMAITGLFLPWSWSSMTGPEWGLLAIGGLFGTMAHLLLVLAFRLAPTSVVSPMIYSQIVAACVLGYLVFGEVPTASTLVGACIVVISGVALIRSKR